MPNMGEAVEKLAVPYTADEGQVGRATGEGS